MELILLPVLVGLLTALVTVLWRSGLLTVARKSLARRAGATGTIVVPSVRVHAAAAARRAARTARLVASASVRAIRDRPRRTPPPSSSSTVGLDWVEQTITHAPAALPPVCPICQHQSAFGASSCERCHAPLTVITASSRGRPRPRRP